MYGCIIYNEIGYIKNMFTSYTSVHDNNNYVIYSVISHKLLSMFSVHLEDGILLNHQYSLDI